jgi:hypothetical protein
MMNNMLTISQLEKGYPNTFKRGLLLITPGGPRVSSAHLRKVFSEKESQAFNKWYGCSTLDTWGIYAWDVEDFLAGRPNMD